MSRWSWHEKLGVIKGPLRRSSDTLSLVQQERKERDQNRREFSYINGVHTMTPLYKELRVCAQCGIEHPQAEMRWTERQWLCEDHYLSLIASQGLRH